MHPASRPTFLSSQGDSVVPKIIGNWCLLSVYLDYVWLVDNLIYFFINNQLDFFTWGAAASLF